MYIDTHCHLNFKAFNKDLNNVINRAREKGVTKIIIPGAKLDSSQKAVEIASEYEMCFAAVGIHPHHVDEVKSLEDNLKSLAREKKVVAIGEIGLDYHEYQGYPSITKETIKLQKELLMLQIKIAAEFNLPIIFHCREAWNDLLEVIESYSRNTNKALAGVFHCFTGNSTQLDKILKMGFYAGYDGNITYSANEELQTVVKETPLDAILLETDAPFLTPVPYRGQRNEPANIGLTSSFIAKLKETALTTVASRTFNNACSLFNL